MSISKIKNCLAVVVLLGATSGYSMDTFPHHSGGVDDMTSLHSLGQKPAQRINPIGPIHLDMRDDCSHRHRRGSAGSDSDSEDEGGFVRIVNKNSKGRVVAAKSQSLDLLKMAAESSAGMAEAERLVRKSHFLIAKAVDCQAKSLEAFARGASIRLESDVVVDRSGRFFETGSACSRAREERETASALHFMAAASESRVRGDLRMAEEDASLAFAEEEAAFKLERDAAALLRTASCSSSDDEAHAKPFPSSKKKKQKQKKKR